MIRRLALVLPMALLPLAPAPAASLTIAKSTTVVADAVNMLNPRALPGSTIDYALVVTNPLANALVPVRQIVITDTIPATLKLRVLDYATGTGPVQFTDGGLLGLFGSGLSYAYGGLGAANDGVEFFDGTSWAYTPVADAAGFDDHVRGVRVTLSGSQTAGGSFRLRYRIELK